MENSSPIFSKIISSCRTAAFNEDSLPVLVAVSGGPDSVALLSAMKMAGIPVQVAHINYHLREEESDRDCKFVVELCKRLDVKSHVFHAAVPEEAYPGESIEMTCRRIRYDIFRQLKKQHNFYRIAVGHNSDDNIETLFINLLRGSGLTGLKAMRPDTGEIIRPLLDFSRKDLLTFLKEIGQDYIVDSTNLHSDYQRNFLRNEVFPLIESRWKGMRTALKKSIGLLQAEEYILSSFINKSLDGVDRILSWSAINKFPSPTTLIFRFIQPFGGSNHISGEIARRLPSPLSGKVWHLSEHYMAVATRKGLEIVGKSESAQTESTENNVNKKYIWEKLKNTSEIMETIHKSGNDSIWLPFPPSRYEWIPVTKKQRIKILGMKGSKSVESVLKEAGISIEDRNKMLILADSQSNEIIWIPGLRRSSLHLLKGTESIIYHLRPISINNPKRD